MSDFDSSLPTRMTDYEDPEGVDKQVEVSEKMIHNRSHGHDPANTKTQQRVTEEGRTTSRGDYDAVNNTKPSSNALIVSERQAAKTEAHQTKRVSAVDGENDSTCLDMALHDENGQNYDSLNPLPVVISESEGEEITDYSTTASLAKDASVNHDYTVTLLKRFIGKSLNFSASGKIKMEFFVNGIPKYTLFNSTSNPSVPLDLKSLTIGLAGQLLRVTITNMDNQPFDVYSTLGGVEL